MSFPRRFTPLLVALVAGSIVSAFVGVTGAGAASGSCTPKSKTCDKTAPTVAFAAPAAGATVAGTSAISGTSSDNVAVASVAVAVDGGAWQSASGTTSWTWTWNTATLSNGSHTLAARATDSAGNSKMVSETVTVSNPVSDTTAPSVSISAPSSSSTVTGTVNVAGSATDNGAVSSIAVAVDGGSWQPASGTTNWGWSWNTAAVADGTHTLAARATDSSGNSTVVSESVTVANPVSDTTPPSVSITSPASGASVSGATQVTGQASDNAATAKVEISVDGGAWQAASGTSSWTYSWNTPVVTNGAHTVVARATDTSGNVASVSESVTVSNSSVAPNTQGTWVSPEGVTIDVHSAGVWTIAQIYSILTANALDLGEIGPGLTIEVQDQSTTQTQSNSTDYMGKYSGYSATIWLQGVNSGFASRPEDILTHEYGHAWSMYWFYLGHNGDWSSYKAARWTNSDGSLTLATDSRTGSTYSWQVTEILADDYRLLFGSSAAISERPNHLNSQIPDPRNVTGLRDFLYNAWRTP